MIRSTALTSLPGNPIIDNKTITSAITGVISIEQIKGNASIAEITLSPEQL